MEKEIEGLKEFLEIEQSKYKKLLEKVSSFLCCRKVVEYSISG